MKPIQAYGGDDFRSIEADNTSSFNCRPATGSSNWSNHAYGYAIDLNPLENPYVSGGRTSHRRSVPYLDRSPYRKGMIVEGGVVSGRSTPRGWGWGGRLERHQGLSALLVHRTLRSRWMRVSTRASMLAGRSGRYRSPRTTGEENAWTTAASATSS